MHATVSLVELRTREEEEDIGAVALTPAELVTLLDAAEAALDYFTEPSDYTRARLQSALRGVRP